METSDRVVVGGDVPKGSRIGPVAFIVHIIGLPIAIKERETGIGRHNIRDDKEEDIVLFIDDTTISKVNDVTDISQAEKLEQPKIM